MPIKAHDDRLGSGLRGVSLDFLRGARAFFGEHGLLDDTMELVCKEEGSTTSVCAITRSTGLSLAESFAITCVTAEADVSLFVGAATTFFSYSWTGTRLADMLYAIIRQVEALEPVEREVERRQRGQRGGLGGGRVALTVSGDPACPAR